MAEIPGIITNLILFTATAERGVSSNGKREMPCATRSDSTARYIAGHGARRRMSPSADPRLGTIGISENLWDKFDQYFNPIEERISKIKSTLRSLKARTKRKLNNALAKAIKMISFDDICE